MNKELVEGLIKKVLPSYEVKEMLGEGSFGAVFKISDSLKERAVKIISLNAAPSIERGSVTSGNKKIERDFRHIVESYEKIACDEIVTVYDFFKLSASEEKRQSTAYAIVVMEIYPANLFDYVVEHFEQNARLLDIERAKSLMEKLAHLLGNLYTRRGFLFEDLKPENLLVKETDGDVRLVVGDIGGLKSLGSVSTTSSQVTLSYCAPEVIRKGHKPDLQSIIYSYGIISYFILEGHLPYENHKVVERMDVIREKGITFDRGDIPDTLKEVIEKCLAFEPEDRYEDFDAVAGGLSGNAVKERDRFGSETIDLNSFMKRVPRDTGPAKDITPPPGRTVLPMDATYGMKASITLRTFTDERKRGETVRIQDEKELIEKVTKEIRDLVVRSGDMYKLQNDNYKVYGDIRVESEAILLIENAKLYFDENGGIISTGTLRAKNAVFSAIDPMKKWRNISLCPTEARMNTIDGCKFRSGKGRPWELLRKAFHIRSTSLHDNYFYGGALFLAGVKEKIIAINNCTFSGCSAQSGGGIFCLRAQPSVESCIFDSCSSGLGGGGISCLESSPSVRNCMLNNCTASREGGGISCFSSHPALEGCSFVSCSTRYLYGGGIYCSASNPVIKSCKFNGCSATKEGGAIYFDGNSNPKILYPAFTNCRPNNVNIEDRAKGGFFR